MATRSGDGFIQCSDGHVRWGLFGAAGVVFVHVDAPGAEPAVLLQLRSQWSHEGGTWSCPGGAIDAGETPFEAALREAAEEVGDVPQPFARLGEYVFAPALEWAYTTVVVAVARRFGRPLNFETEDVAWVPAGAVVERPLHRGFAAAWPQVLPLVRTATPLGT